jgi:hypothetical protein
MQKVVLGQDMEPTPLVDIPGMTWSDEFHELPFHVLPYPPRFPAQHSEEDVHETAVKPGELPFG